MLSGGINSLQNILKQFFKAHYRFPGIFTHFSAYAFFEDYVCVKRFFARHNDGVGLLCALVKRETLDLFHFFIRIGSVIASKIQLAEVIRPRIVKKPKTTRLGLIY